jgi:hypothetical protein
MSELGQEANSILSMLLFHRKRAGLHVSFLNRWTDSLVDTIFNIFTFLAWPVARALLSNYWARAFCAFGTASINRASALLKPEAA